MGRFRLMRICTVGIKYGKKRWRQNYSRYAGVPWPSSSHVTQMSTLYFTVDYW